jgi:diguanylate cyclase (GGDEF)-like protein/PAS domain S-box-containing protein
MAWRSLLLRAVRTRLAIVAVLSLAGAAATYWAVDNALEHIRLVSRTHDVLAGIDQIFSLLKEAESAQRGYLLSRAATHLQAYRRAAAAVRRDLDSLTELTRDNPRQQARLDRLKPLLNERLARLRSIVDDFHDGRRNAVETALAASDGRILMDQIGTEIATMRLEEQDLLVRRQAVAGTADLLLARAMPVGAAVILFVLGLAYYRIDHATARRTWYETELKKALLEVEDLYNHAPCGYYSHDEDGTILNINDTALAWLGYSRDEVIGRLDAEDLHAPESAARFRESFAEFIKSGRQIEYECGGRFRCRDGSVKDVLLRSTAVRDNAGGFLAARSTFADISGMRRVEEALRQSEERFRGSFETAVIGMALVGLDGRWLQVNRSMCQIVGYTEEELLARTFQDITHPDDLEADLAFVRRLLASEITSYRMEKRYFHKNGTLVYIVLSVSLVRDAVGEPVHFVAQIEDITERKRIEAALRESEERFRAFMDHSPAIAFMKDDQSRLLYVNKRLEEVFQIQLDQVKGRLGLDGMPSEFVAEASRSDRTVLETLRPVELFQTVPTPDGRIRTWHVLKFAFRAAEGRKILGGVGLDVTEQKELERRLEQANARLEVLAASDPLTGLANRRASAETLHSAYARAARYHEPLSVLMIDVDQFKSYNDSFGHPAGDEVLKLMAELLRSLVRASDICGRQGGEEFIVVLPETDAAGALELGGRLRSSVADLNWPRRAVTVSIGAASLGPDVPDALALVAEADRALYTSKRLGRDRVTHAQGPIEQQAATAGYSAPIASPSVWA